MRSLFSFLAFLSQSSILNIVKWSMTVCHVPISSQSFPNTCSSDVLSSSSEEGQEGGGCWDLQRITETAFLYGHMQI
jgi:hypothetical protein